MPEPGSIQVEITDASEFHCFKLTLYPRNSEGQPLELMFHAAALIDLIHKSSVALSQWQKQTTTYLLQQKTGWTEEELREAGLIA